MAASLFLLLTSSGQKAQLDNEERIPSVEVVEEDQAVLDELNAVGDSPVPLDLDPSEDAQRL